MNFKEWSDRLGKQKKSPTDLIPVEGVKTGPSIMLDQDMRIKLRAALFWARTRRPDARSQRVPYPDEGDSVIHLGPKQAE